MSWRDNPPTKNQLDYIKIIESIIPKKFTGKTKGEACDFISAFKETDKEMKEWDRISGEYQAIVHENAGDRI